MEAKYLFIYTIGVWSRLFYVEGSRSSGKNYINYYSYEVQLMKNYDFFFQFFPKCCDQHY